MTNTMPVLTKEKRQALIACANKLITGSRSDNVAELAQIALAVLEQQGGWINCNERTPEEGGRYWCYVAEQNSLGLSHYQWNCSWNGEVWSDAALSGTVTHWMPLPAPPQPSTPPQIDNDGWIELVDEEMPVHPDSVVEVKMRNGATDGPREAARFFWYRGNEVRDEMGCDIIAYRVIDNNGREG